MTKTTMVREFEEELRSAITAFKQRQASSIAIRMQPMREMMISDLESLIKQCDITIASSARRDDDFKSIIIDTNRQMSEVSL